MFGRARGQHAAPTGGPARLARLAVAALTVTATALVAAPPARATSSGGGGGTVLDYNQCANGTSHSAGCDKGWINGIVNGNNSSYREGEVVPQRALFQLGSTTSTQTHTMTLRYDTLKGSVHAFDSLATWNATETTADRCQGLAACPGGAPSSYPVPDDAAGVPPLGPGSNGSSVTASHMLPAGPQRQLVLYGGTIVKVGVPDHYGAGTGNEYADVTVSFTAPASSGSQTLLLLYGGHLANSLDWGSGEGASSISGGPYHNSLIDLDGAKIGDRDNQVMNAAGPVPPASYSLTKTPDRATVSVGDQVGFTITVTSNGGSTAKGVTTDDVLPTGTGLSWSEAPDVSACAISDGHLRCSFGDLAPGASASVHIVSGTAVGSPGTISNTVTATSSNAGTRTATASITVLAPSLSLTKTADAATVPAGRQIGFTIKVANAGPGSAYGVQVKDPLPSGAGLSWTLAPGTPCTLTTGTQQNLSCPLGTLAAGAAVTIHVTSTTSYATPSPVTNYAYLCATNAGPLSAHDSVTLTAPAPSLSLTKRADAASVDAGQQIGFTLTLTNGGPGTAYKAVLDDPLPSAPGVAWSISPATPGCSLTGAAPQKLHCDVGDLGVGSFTVHVVSATTGATSGTLTNTATAKADNAGQVCAYAAVTVKQPKVSFSKTADNGTVTAGDQAGWTVTVVNNGTGTATGLAISDPLPALGGTGWSLDQPTPCTLVGLQVSCPVGDLAPGKSFSVHLTGTTSSATGSSLYNKATLTGSNVVTTWADSTITVLHPSTVTTKTADATSVSSGDPIGFTVTTKNTGNGDARGVVISDPLPGGLGWQVDSPASGCAIAAGALTCTVGTLVPGASFTTHVSARTTPSTDGRLTNTATTTSTNAPTSQGSAYVDVLLPHVSLVKTADKATVDANQAIGFVVTLSNSGPGTARTVSLTDALPTGPGVSWSLASPVPGCSLTGSTLTCTRASLGSGESLSVHLVSGTGPTSCGAYPNTATATSSNATLAPASATVTVRCLPVLQLTKTSTCGQGTVPPGGLMSYTLTYSNVGTGPAKAASLVDAPDATTVITTAPGASVTHSPERATWDLGMLPPGQSGSRVVVVKVGTANGTITNRASLSDPDATTATSSLTTTVSDAGAGTRGSAYAADLRGLPIVPSIGLLPAIDPNIYTLGLTGSQAPGTPHDGGTNVIPPLSVPGLAGVTLLAQTSHSSTDGGTARTQATSTTGAVDLLAGAVTADAVRAVSTSSATALTAGSDALGSTVTNLKVNGSPVSSVPGTSVNVLDPTGTTVVARLDVLTVTPPDAALAGGSWSSSQEVTALTLTLLKSTALFPAGVVLKVADARSDASYPSGLVCGSTPASVEGEAFTLLARGNVGGVDLTTARQGDVQLPATGGAAGSTVNANALGTALLTSTGTTSTAGDLSPNPHATAHAHVEDLSLLGGAVTARAVDVTATSTADGIAAGTSFAVTFTQLVVGGTPITLPVTPNTVIAVPQPSGAVLYVVLDEETSSTTAATDTTGTVNAIHAYVLKGGQLTAEVIVSSAHAGAHTDHLV